ncbi:S-layer homology domain-containing protein [Paenibacillus qinlingensis]|uniref:S-layer homology domain-containing protein n=1 Tax=Paenibacillus qinlingensis TaxID=1837343 RepID=UPI001565627C|nr:S-layer homology domain-containing protein [Paenibacillus qinlingensis]
MIAINNLKCWKSRIPLYIFLLLCMLIAPLQAHANSVPTASAYTLSGNTSLPEVGGSFTVTATAQVSELFAFEAIFRYDPQKVKLIRADSAANGNLIKPDGGEGTIILAWSKEGNEQLTNGTVRMAELTFNVLKEGESEVIWQSLRIANRSLQEVAVSPGVSFRTNIRTESSSGNVGDIGGVNVPNTDGIGKEPALLAPDAVIITDPAQTSQFSAQAVSLTAESGNLVRVALNVEQVLKEIHSTNGKSTFVIMVPTQESASISVDVPSEVLQAIQSKSGGSGFLAISSSVGMYKLPIDQLKLDASSKVTITIAPVSEEQAHAMGTIIADEGFTLAGAPVDFSVSILDASGQATEMHDYESAFAARTLPAGHMDPDKSAAVLFRADGTLAPVPTLFVKQPDGSYMALIHRMGNSTYGLITGSRTFADLIGHWSKGDIETMAGRLLINGDTEGRFRPDDAITRAEFAKLLTNALALPDKGDSMTFRDVEPSAWYSRSLLTAVSFGLIKGYDGGVFHPDSFVSREEIAVMLDRALHLTGYHYDAPANFAQLLDMDQLNDWSKDAIYKMLGLGILIGDQGNNIQPSQSATRAEAAVMLKRMLIKLSFMNE